MGSSDHVLYKDDQPIYGPASYDDCWVHLHKSSNGASCDWLLRHEGYSIVQTAETQNTMTPCPGCGKTLIPTIDGGCGCPAPMTTSGPNCPTTTKTATKKPAPMLVIVTWFNSPYEADLRDVAGLLEQAKGRNFRLVEDPRLYHGAAIVVWEGDSNPTDKQLADAVQARQTAG